MGFEGFQLPPPTDWQKFERLCKDLWASIWGDPSTQLNGRNGQPQHGVDVFGRPALGAHYAGVQCKRRDNRPDSAEVTEDDLVAEVEKAKGFEPQIESEFILATTAPRDAKIQTVARRLTEENQRTGIFSVTVWSWDDIQDAIGKHPEVFDTHFSSIAESVRSFDRARTADVSRSAASASCAPIHTSSSGDTTGASHAQRARSLELDEAKSLIARGESANADFLLKRMRNQQWSELGPAQRGRWCTLLADAELHQGNSESAARLLIEARGYVPDEENASVNEVLARKILGDPEGARNLALDVRARFPNSPSAHATCIDTAPTLEAALAEVERLPIIVAGALEVLLAIAARPELGRRAQSAAREAVRSSDDPRAWFGLGLCLMAEQLEKLNPQRAAGDLAVLDGSRLREAQDAFSKVIEQARQSGHRGMGTAARVRRATIASALGDYALCRSDTEEALRLSPSDPEALIGAARLAEGRQDHPRAVELLRGLPARLVTSDSEFLLGIALWNRNLEGDRGEAIQKLRAVAEIAQGHDSQAAQLVAEGYISTGRVDLADAFVRGLPASTDSALRSVLMSRIAASKGDAGEAATRLDEAVGLVGSTTSRMTVEKVAKLLASGGRYAEAIPLLERTAIVGPDLDTGRLLVACARKASRHDVILEYCRRVREAGLWDDDLLQSELAILDQYDAPAALSLLERVIEKNPLQHPARVHLVTLALRIGRTDIAERHLGLMPLVSEVDDVEGEAVVSALQQLGRSQDACSYAYDLLRLHFLSHHAHRAFWMAVLWRDRGDDESIDVDVVCPGAAVVLAEGKEERAFVLEDSNVPAKGVIPFEIDADSPTARLMLGKRVGETVLISSGPGNRSAVVKSILPKQVFRFQDVLQNWQIRFPQQQEMWMVRVVRDDGTGDADFSELLNTLKAGRDRDIQAECFYREHVVPIHVFSRLIGRGDIHAMHHLAQSDGIPIRCSLGSRQEYEEAAAALRSASEIVIDPTAMGSLLMLDELERLDSLAKIWLVSPTTLAVVRVFQKELENNLRSAATAGANQDGPVLVVHGDQHRESTARLLSKLDTVVSTKLRMAGVQAAAHIEPSQREELTSLLGAAGLESAVLAANPSRVLWTDDLAVAGIARDRFGTRRVWTQAVYRCLLEDRAIRADIYERTSALLIGWGYTFTGASQGIMRTAGTLSNWDPNGWAMRRAIAYLGSIEVARADSIQLGVLLASDCYRFADLASTRRSSMLRILETIRDRPDMTDGGLDDFGRLLPRVFGLNLLGLDDAVKSFVAWRKAVRARVVVPHSGGR